MDNTPFRPSLRNLSLPTRLVLAVFLASVGFGYFSALVQLHFQHAVPGELLPGQKETVDVYHGREGMSELERLLTADETKPFNGGGTMRPAFTFKSAGWAGLVRKAKIDKQILEKARAEREGERLALIDWIRNGASKEAYDNDAYPLPAELAGHAFTAEYLGDPQKEGGPKTVKIQSILNDRCARCHGEGKSVAAAPLQTHDEILVYCDPETGGGMSLTKLAQTTHVHLLGFSMLFLLTGLIFSFTSYPYWVRGFWAPFTLAAQVVDIACWWLSRANVFFTHVMVFTGTLVALGLLVHVVGGLFDLFGRVGKVVLVLLILAGGGAGYVVKTRIVEPYLQNESLNPEIRDIYRKPGKTPAAPGKVARVLPGGAQER